MPSLDSVWPVITVQADVPLPASVTEATLTSLAAHILEAEGGSGEWPLGIQFVDDPTMQAAHLEFMGINEPTDIMTFPYDDGEGDDVGPWTPASDDEGDQGQGGDLMISVDRAAEHAAEARWSTDQEIFFLVAHGILHLLGWDDATDEDRAAMLDRQRALVSAWPEAPAARR